MKKTIGILVLMLVGLLFLSGIANAAVNITNAVGITKVEVDGTDVTDDDTIRLDVERGQEIEVEITIEADNASLDDVQIEVMIRGYDHDDLIEDITDVFDVKEDRRYKKTLTLKIPERIDLEDDDEYTMVILVESRNGVFGVLDKLKWNVNLGISGKRHQLRIRDVVLSPETEVEAGRALLATVRIKNYGEKDEDGVKVRVSIPELGVSASDFIDEIESEESETSEELYMRIPAAAKPGVYDVKVEVIYDDGDEVERETTEIAVVSAEGMVAPPSTGKTVIAVGVESQEIAAGASAMYPVTITNAGAFARTYTVTADGSDWAVFTISPTNTVLLQAGESASMFVNAAVKQDATAGQKMFALTVSSAGETLKQVALKADVKAAAAPVTGVKKGLEIGLVVLVVLLVILGLIIGFSKMRGGEEEEKSTYY